MASEASYVYILSEQKFIKNAKKWYILAIFRKPETCCQLVLPDWSINDPKLVENAKTPIFKCDILGFFKHSVFEKF